MNIKNLKLIIFLFVFHSELSSSIGCMDNSYHMQRPGDMKEWHYVHCNCPCENIISYRGKCSRCFHYGNPDRGKINALQELDIIFR